MNNFNCWFASLALIAGGIAGTAVAAPKPDSAPVLEARPIPVEIIGTSSGKLDIDFRSGDWTFIDGGTAQNGIVTVTASEGTLRSPDCGDDPNCPTGFGAYGNDDDGLEKSESLKVEIVSEASATAAFDVNGVWLSGFVRARNGEAGEIEIVGIDANDRHVYSFSWKDVDPADISDACDSGVEPPEGNCDNEFFVGFGETLRITSVVVTGTRGAFSVAGFSQRPIVIKADECGQDGGVPGCFSEIAQNVFLDMLPRAGGDEGVPGDRGVYGEVVKNGAYEEQDDIRLQCQPGFDSSQLPYAEWLPLSIDLDGDANTAEVVMKPHQCGYPHPDRPDQPVIYILDLDGSGLTIVEDTITMKFIDDREGPQSQGDYFCNASDTSKRPGIGWVPHSQQNPVYDEIPVLGADGAVVVDAQDVATGPCGSLRGRFGRYSYVVYHWVNAPGTPYRLTIAERIDRLQVSVEQYFPCVQKGINQSTLSDDTGHIRKSFEMGRYQRAVDYIAEMREHVLAPRLNDEISQCFFDLGTGDYLKDGEPGSNRVAANVVGNLLVQLDHLRWIIRSTVLGESPAEIPAP